MTAEPADEPTPGCGDCDAHTSTGCRFGLTIIGTHWQDCHRTRTQEDACAST